MNSNAAERSTIFLLLLSFSTFFTNCDAWSDEIEEAYIPAATMTSIANLTFFAVSTGLKYQISCNPAFLETHSMIKIGFFYFEYKRVWANTTLTFLINREENVENYPLTKFNNPTLKLYHDTTYLNDYEVNYLTCNFLIHFVSPTMMEIQQVSEHLVGHRKILPIQLSRTPLLEFALLYEMSKVNPRTETCVFVSGIPRRSVESGADMEKSQKNLRPQTTVFRDILVANLSISLFTFFLVVSGFAGIITR